jgi:hypothetical protein
MAMAAWELSGHRKPTANAIGENKMPIRGFTGISQLTLGGSSFDAC